MKFILNLGKKFHLERKDYFYHIKSSFESRLFSSSTFTTNSKQAVVWDRLIRFVAEDQEIYFGQPINPSSSSEGSGVIGKDEQASNELKANVIDAQIPIIRCVGLNYKAHAHETSQPLPKYPILFIKPSTSLQNPNDKILVPSLANNNQTDYEAELAVVLNKDCKNVDAENALNYVLGYTCANDVSARKWQGKTLGSGQWCFSKGFDTFCPIGPVLVSPKLIKNPNSL
ncbi:4120_t:CDS:2, partial [Entrophospora sp. SA101]